MLLFIIIIELTIICLAKSFLITVSIINDKTQLKPLYMKMTYHSCSMLRKATSRTIELLQIIIITHLALKSRITSRTQSAWFNRKPQRSLHIERGNKKKIQLLTYWNKNLYHARSSWLIHKTVITLWRRKNLELTMKLIY